MTNNEAIAILTGYKNNPLVSDMAIEAFSMAIKALEQEQKTGKWKKVIDEKGYIDGNPCYFYHYECSICGTMNRYFDNTNYCPDCGAKMIEPQESEDKE